MIKPVESSWVQRSTGCPHQLEKDQAQAETKAEIAAPPGVTVQSHGTGDQELVDVALPHF
nr:hypothetical protein [Reyranella soli]